MIERVARAIEQELLTQRRHNLPSNYTAAAIEAIKAMKEPTEKMMDAAILYLPAVIIEDGFSPDVLYGVMIDAAAKE